MKLEIKKTTCDELLDLEKRNSKTPDHVRFTPDQAAWIEKTQYVRSIFIDGKLMACGGVNKYWENRGEAWAIFDPNCRMYFLALHKAFLKLIDGCPFIRVEASVDCDFRAGHRWMKALGFQMEAPRLRHFLPNGHDAALYSKVKNGVTANV
jgi:hypothetical protein